MDLGCEARPPSISSLAMPRSGPYAGGVSLREHAKLRAAILGLALSACHHTAPQTPRIDLQEVADAINPEHLRTAVMEMSGAVAVNVDGQTFNISERHSSGGKARFRSYWEHALAGLGMQPTELAYPTKFSAFTGEPDGHNVEAVLSGNSADSVVIIIH